MFRPRKHTSFTKAVKLKDDEVVVFSWIVYNSRSHRDAVLKKVMSDPRMPKDMKAIAFRRQTHDLWRLQTDCGDVATPLSSSDERGKAASMSGDPAQDLSKMQ